ncbi:MAG TPA: metallophosphoesterase [Planctomycetota bacterium]|nr:metallophosphoesterase [Planctomycetota bacterium]
MPTRVMFCGDVHLGRRPAGLPKELQEQSGLSPSELGSKVALSRAVEEACRARVDAFVFAGDVVERENSVFEAFGALTRAVEPLMRAGMRVFAVAGNHDVETLPRLARSFPQFHLLGAAGRWEDVSFAGSDGPRICLRGWSFPAQQVSESPFSSAQPRAPDDVAAVLGVVHGDLDNPGSRYAPIRARELEKEIAVKAWFLGHIHKPSLDPRSQRPIGYLGSITALDRTETGAHGPWIVEVAASGVLRIEQRPIAPLAFESVTLDASEWTDPEAFELALRGCYARTRDAFRAAANSARAVGFNVVLQGATPALTALRARLSQFESRRLLSTEFEGLFCFVAAIEDRMHEPVDLAARSLSSGPAGLLARRLLALQDPASPLAAELICRARKTIEAQSARREFLGVLAPAQETDEEIRARLVRGGWRALEQLEATRQGALA